MMLYRAYKASFNVQTRTEELLLHLLYRALKEERLQPVFMTRSGCRNDQSSALHGPKRWSTAPQIHRSISCSARSKHQITLAEEQSKRIAELEQSKRQLVHIRDTPSPPRNRRGRSPHRFRSRSPRRSISVRSPSHERRLPRRRSLRRSPPRRSPPRRSLPRRNRRTWSSSSSSSNDECNARGGCYTYGPFTRRIRDNLIPRGLEKPPQMDSYDGTSDPDEYIENIEVVLMYRSVRGAMTWFKNLRINSIDTWGHLCHEFTTHFTASMTQPETVASL